MKKYMLLLIVGVFLLGLVEADLMENYSSPDNFIGLDNQDVGQGFREGFVGTNTTYNLAIVGVRMCSCDETPSEITSANLSLYLGDGNSVPTGIVTGKPCPTS